MQAFRFRACHSFVIPALLSVFFGAFRADAKVLSYWQEPNTPGFDPTPDDLFREGIRRPCFQPFETP